MLNVLINLSMTEKLGKAALLRLFFCVFLAGSFSQAAQAETALPDMTLEEQVRLYQSQHQDNAGEGKVVTLVVENDLFGKGTDQNYTSGVRLSYFDASAEMSDLAHYVADHIPTFSLNEFSSLTYSIGQNLYTPDDISLAAQPANDRPWAAHLYGSMGLVTVTDDHIDEIEAQIGVVGPLALGEQTQKFIHTHVSDSPTPRGWKNQLDNEPTLNIGWQRRWPKFYTYDTDHFNFSVAPHAGATLGNVYTFVNTGFSLALHPRADWLQDTPLRVQPAIPGTGFFTKPEKKWTWMLFAGMEGRAMARNIFLDGNTFSDSHDIDKRYFVGDAHIGLSITYDRMRVSYTLNHRSKEFKGQDSPDLFGAISLGYRF